MIQAASQEIWEKKYKAPTDTCIDDSFKRVAKGLAAVENNPSEWEEKFYWAMQNGAIPAGRIMANVGTDKANVSLINCLSGDTPVLTKFGLVPIKELSGKVVEVLNGKGDWVEVPFKHFGEQETYKIKFKWGNNKKALKEVYATKDHRWFLEDGRVVTTEFWLTGGLNNKTRTISHLFTPKVTGIDMSGVLHGMIYGDGSALQTVDTYYLNLCGLKKELAYIPESYGYTGTYYQDSDTLRFTIKNTINLKQLPSSIDPEYIKGFIYGVLATDGNVSQNAKGCEAVLYGQKELVDWVNNYSYLANIIPTYNRKSANRGEFTNYGKRNKDIWVIGLHPATLEKEYIFRTFHSDKFKLTPDGLAAINKWKVHSVSKTPRIEDVYCCHEPITTAFCIFNGMKTGQCTVSQTLHDSMEGILDGVKQAGITLAAGCGIGYDFSTLRPSGAYVAGVGATTSGALSFMDIYDAMCFTVASAGGRRGAQMGVLEVSHPDILNFIKAKREDGRLRQFNLSVLITDEFMEAVKNNEEWELIFPVHKKEYDEDGLYVWKKIHWKEDYFVYQDSMVAHKIYHIMSAREIWDLIMKSTYDYAEPGVIFIDEVNRMNPLRSIETIRASNPCVTGDTLVLTNEGYKRIDSLVDKTTTIWNGYTWSEVTPKITGENQEIFEVSFSDGSNLKCTPYHTFILKDSSKVKAIDLKVGDKLNKFTMPVIEGKVDLHEKKAYTFGFYAGDGSDSDSDKAEIWLYGVKQLLIDYLDTNKVWYDTNKDRCQVRVANEYNQKSFVPNVHYTIQTRLNWLAGIIDSDGTINSKEGALNITSINKQFLSDIKLMLNTLGESSTLSLMKSAKATMLPDSKGGYKTYPTQDCYRLVIRASSVFNLYKLGLRTHRVNVSNINLNRNASRFIKITGITKVEDAKVVYCFNEPLNHTGTFNSVVTGQCGEQMLNPNGSCLLGSIDLTKFVVGPFTDKAYFDYHKLFSVAAIFTRMLDNVVDINGLPLEAQREELLAKRRHGMGFLGLGSALVMLGIDYGSEKSVEFTNEVMKRIVTANWDTSWRLAKEKGIAPCFKDKHVFDSWLSSPPLHRLKLLSPEIFNKLEEHGSRFSHATSIAPTGTISLALANNASNGIEPSFAHSYKRNVIKAGKKSKEQMEVVSNELAAYRLLKGGPSADAPTHWKGANDIDPMDHIKIQCAAQYWVDSAISKTINVATDYDFEKFKEIYMYAYQHNLKGCTTFRFNEAAFSGVLVQDKDLKNTTYIFQLENGDTFECNGTDTITYEGEQHNATNLYESLKEGYYGKL